MEDKYIIPMLERAFKILEYMYIKGESVSFIEIVEDLEMPKTTVFRIMATMEKWGYIHKMLDEEEYVLGKSLIKLGQQAAGDIDITDIAMPYLRELSEKTGESVNLGVIYEDKVLTIANVKGEDFYLISKLIPISPLNCSSMGKQFLSELSDERIKKYFDAGNAEKRTINSIQDYEDFLIEKEKIKEEAISYDREEYEYGLSCMAAAIRDKDHNLIAAISISGPTTRLKYKGEEKLKEELREAVRKYQGPI